MPHLVWGAIGLTFLASFGYTVVEKIKSLHDKHGIIHWNSYDVDMCFTEQAEKARKEKETQEAATDEEGMGDMAGLDDINNITTIYE